MVSRASVAALAAALVLPSSLLIAQPTAAAPAPVISGRVVDLAGQPIAGVTVYQQYGGSSSPSDVTGEDGVFKVAALAENGNLIASNRVDQGSTFVSQSSAILLDLRTDTVNGTDVGDFVLHRLTEVRSIRTVDTEGDPLPGARTIYNPSDGCLYRAERPDLPRLGERPVVNCSSYLPDASYNNRSDTVGRLPIALPLGGEDKVLSDLKVQVSDPATNDVYIENFSEGTYDATLRTYTFVIEGADAPPALPPSPVQNLYLRSPEQGNEARVSWYWDRYMNANQRRAPGTAFRVQSIGDRGLSTDEEVPLSDSITEYAIETAQPGEQVTVTVTVLSEAGSSESKSLSFQVPADAPSGLAAPTVEVNNKRNTALVSWAEPTDDGGAGPDFNYWVYVDGKRRGPGGEMFLLLKRLTERKHVVYVQAYNQWGHTESEPVGFKVK
jgi:hypothetical protein